MATRKETVDYFLDQMALVGDLRAKKMFGEYGIYHRDVLVALACDDQLFIKPTDAGRLHEAECDLSPPYPGAKPSWRVSDALLETPERLAEFVRVTSLALTHAKARTKPAPAKKAPAKKTPVRKQAIGKRGKRRA